MLRCRLPVLQSLLLRARAVAVLVPLLFCAAAGAHAQESARTRILVVAADPSGETDVRLAAILEESVALELGQMGYDVLAGPPEDATSEDFLDDTGSPDADSIGRIAQEVVAAHVVLIRYTRKESLVTLLMTCHLPGTGQIAGTTTQTGAMGLHLDELIAQGVRELRDSVEECTEPVVTTTETSPEPVPESLPDTQQTTTVVPPPTPAPAPQAPVHRAQVAVGIAPFFTTGRAGEYFTSGVAESFSVGYRLPILNDHFTTSVHLGAYTFQAAGAVASSTNALIPIGLQIQFQTGGTGLFVSYARVSGGPALFTISPNGMDTLTKLTGYVHAGIGLSIMFLDHVGLGVEAGYTMFFEKYFPIGGFVPSVFVHMRR